MQLLSFLNLGGAELGLLLLLIISPFFLMVYCIIDLLRSRFKDSNTKLLFLILVLFAPFIGSIAYLILKRNYVKPFNQGV